VLALKCYSRARTRDHGKYAGNNGIAAAAFIVVWQITLALHPLKS